MIISDQCNETVPVTPIKFQVPTTWFEPWLDFHRPLANFPLPESRSFPKSEGTNSDHSPCWTCWGNSRIPSSTAASEDGVVIRIVAMDKAAMGGCDDVTIHGETRTRLGTKLKASVIVLVVVVVVVVVPRHNAFTTRMIPPSETRIALCCNGKCTTLYTYT